MGFRVTPGRLYRDLEHPRPDLALSRTITPGERRQREHGTEPLIERVRSCAPELLSARSWEELSARLATHGLTLHRKYTGIVISDGETQVKASRVAQDLSLRNCERRFNERFPDRLAPPEIERVADAVRSLVTHEALMARARAAGDELVRARSALAIGERTHVPTGALQDLRGKVREAESRVALTRNALTQHSARSEPVADLRRTIGVAVDRMLPHELRLFQRLLKPPELALAQWCRSHVRELLRERSQPAFS